MVFINLVAPTSTNFAGSPFQIFVGAATRAKGAAASRLTVDRFKFSCAIIRLNTRGDLEVSFTGERDTGAPSIKRGFAIENGASARFSPSLLSFEPSTDLLSRYRRVSLLAPIFISPRSRIRGIRDRNRYYAEGCNDCLEGEREREKGSRDGALRLYPSPPFSLLRGEKFTSGGASVIEVGASNGRCRPCKTIHIVERTSFFLSRLRELARTRRWSNLTT